jgi:NAD(P)-dependent dehydrogenase (short-subunit alcohol dehydrogenase family)
MNLLAVTGGAQGIGRAIALHFAAHGYAVSIADLAADAGEELVSTLLQRGTQALFVPTDVAQADEIERWLVETERVLGCPDVLVNNAGISARAPLLELKLEAFDRVLAVNLRGTFLCAQGVARRMVARGGGGAIVNIASTRAFMSEAGTEAYAASKGGIVALTHAFAVSLGPHRIRVNAVAPGWIETRDWQHAGRATPPQHSERDREQHPVGRVGRPADIAEACLFLAEHAGFTTG